MKTLKHILWAAAVMGLAACTNDETFSPYDNDSNAVRIRATVGELNSRSNPTDNGEASAKFKDGDQISVKTDDQSAVVYTFDGTDWTPETGKYLKWNKEQHNFNAYYPATYTGNEDVHAEQNTVELIAASDYMSFEQTGVTKTADATLQMVMQRQTARIVIDATDCTWKDQYLADDKTTVTHEVKSILVHCKGKDGMINIQSCEVDNVYYALVNPSANADATAEFLTVTVGPKNSTDEEEYDKLIVRGIPVLKAGNSYTCQLTLGKDKVELGSITMAGWTTGESLGSGKATDGYVMYVTDGVHSYHVYTLAGLLEVNRILTAPGVTSQMLSADITLYDTFTLPAPTGDEKSNWIPIGTESNPFNGTLYGNGKAIIGLVIDNPNTAYQALIGCLDGSVYNLTLEGCTVKGNGRVGGIAGRISSGRMNECTVKATGEYPVVIESKEAYAGGLVAEAFNVNISNCSLVCEASASITIKGLDDSSYVGGIAGSHEGNGTMTQCDVTNNGGTITLQGGNNVGGLVGMNEGSSISDCNVDGVSVKGLTYVGGFAGENNNTASITGTNTVKNCKVEGWEGFTGITVGNNASVSVTEGEGNSITTVPKNTYN